MRLKATLRGKNLTPWLATIFVINGPSLDSCGCVYNGSSNTSTPSAFASQISDMSTNVGPCNTDLASLINDQGVSLATAFTVWYKDGDVGETQPTTLGRFEIVSGRYDAHGRQRSLPKIFALIVGINRYQEVVIPSLQGCIQDSEDFRYFLEEDLKVPSDHILVLYNESATRGNILSAFDSHLIYNSKIKKGDLIFFYYAGHGGRMAAPDGWDCVDKQIETICPYDETVFMTPPVSFVEKVAALDQHTTGSRGQATGLPDQVAGSVYQTTDSGEKPTAQVHITQSSKPISTVSCIPDHKFGEMMRRLAETKGDNIVGTSN